MKARAGGWTESVALLVVWVGLLFAFGAASDNFLSTGTFTALANRIPALAVVAVGMTFVLIMGGIDLSVGSVMGLGGAILGIMITRCEWPLWAAILLCLGVCWCAGTINGLISVRLGIPSFVVTLGMLEIARGLAYLVTHSQTQYIGAPVELFMRPVAGTGLTLSFIICVPVVVAGQIVLSRTVFGRKLVAIGANETAVRLSGINPHPIKIAVFALLGGLTGLGSLFHTSRFGSADPNAGIGLELAAIAAVVIGGTSLLGGRGSVINSFLGVVVIATLESGLAHVGASEPVKRVVTGCVIILAVIMDAWRHQLAGGGYPLLTRLLSFKTRKRNS